MLLSSNSDMVGVSDINNHMWVLTLEDFKDEFEARHDFDSEDIQTLQKKFPYTEFVNIPDAWIICLDRMLSKIYKFDPDFIISVQQHYGFLSVVPYPDKEYTEALKKTVYATEKQLYAIDGDLHIALDYIKKKKK